MQKAMRWQEQIAKLRPVLWPVAQRLAELETLRASGVLTEAEYTHKREQLIAEI